MFGEYMAFLVYLQRFFFAFFAIADDFASGKYLLFDK